MPEQGSVELSEEAGEILAHLPADGTPVGNGRLRDLTGLDPDDYAAAAEELKSLGLVTRAGAAGQPGIGRERGPSGRRVRSNLRAFAAAPTGRRTPGRTGILRSRRHAQPASNRHAAPRRRYPLGGS